MFKVVIADDEIRVCQLIQALIDWDHLGLELAGTAHNGIEALELIEKKRPDILITDIRMPGCSGLELIEKVKSKLPDLRIVIISGYAHFEYAQQAIRFGVGDYILKPVNKTELSQTLEKLKNQILEQRESQIDQVELMNKTRRDAVLLRDGLIEGLIDQKEADYSIEELRDTYKLHVQPGVFQAFCMCMDSGAEELGEDSVNVLMEKAQETLQRILKEKCFELLMGVRDHMCAGFINYAKENQDDIRRALKLSINQMGVQRSLFQPVSFSVSLGSAEHTPEHLNVSMKTALLLVEERLLRGTGRIYERFGSISSADCGTVLDHYLNGVTRAVDLHSAEFLSEIQDIFEKELLEVQNLKGYELLKAIDSAINVFAMKMQIKEKEKFIENFRRKSISCGSAEIVLQYMKKTVCEYMTEYCNTLENEAVRPIRKAKQYIQEHYREPITQEEISSYVGLSSTYFSGLFKKTEGEGFAKYLINVRMEQAKRLLRETNLSVSDICKEVGYNDVKHFTHTFEKAAGVKPAVYRKLYG